ncbi:LuxR C-terminal-related transcriptional regulator [Streptomyces nojiriensis]|uniref:LuxR C-terminal-related transcriptional regulator n=1 Tax=Streptomyces nojiriensis TaxID=66374 RepID=UPI0036DE2206
MLVPTVFDDEITARLHLSTGTVKIHIGRLLSKLAARDRARPVIAAYESGVVSASDGGLEARGVETGEIMETDHWR